MEAQGKNISELMIQSGVKKREKKKGAVAEVEPSSPSKSASDYEKYIKEILRKAIMPLQFEYIPEVEEFEELLKINI